MIKHLKKEDTINRINFDVLFSRYAKGLLVYARNFVLTQEEAEDIVQDIFVNLWEKSDKLSNDSIKSYLIKATKNSCLNHLKHLRVRSDYQSEILSKGDYLLSIDPEHYVGSDLRVYINKLIDKLPPQQKKTFVMNKFEGKSYKEIAEELDISPRTVEKHIEQASKTLRKELNNYLQLLIFLLTN